MISRTIIKSDNYSPRK